MMALVLGLLGLWVGAMIALIVLTKAMRMVGRDRCACGRIDELPGKWLRVDDTIHERERCSPVREVIR